MPAAPQDYDGPGKGHAFGRAMKKIIGYIRVRTPLQGDYMKMADHSDGVMCGVDYEALKKALQSEPPGGGTVIGNGTITLVVCVGGTPTNVTFVTKT
jgi:hypothetical protein